MFCAEYAVSPSNTIPSGGITLTFTGMKMNLDVVQKPVLEVYQPMGVPLVSYMLCTSRCIILLSSYSGATAVLWTIPPSHAPLLV